MGSTNHPTGVVGVPAADDELLVPVMRESRAVLDNGGDVAVAARILHVHRTTLYYRLGRIASLIGVDLRAGHGRTDLQLALWLAAYRGTEG